MLITEIRNVKGVTHRIPEIKFEDQRLTSFAGLVVYQALFSRIGLKQQLSGCYPYLKVSPVFGHGVVVLLLVVHLLLGYRRLQEMRYYADDPMVQRLRAGNQGDFAARHDRGAPGQRLFQR